MSQYTHNLPTTTSTSTSTATATATQQQPSTLDDTLLNQPHTGAPATESAPPIPPRQGPVGGMSTMSSEEATAGATSWPTAAQRGARREAQREEQRELQTAGATEGPTTGAKAGATAAPTSTAVPTGAPAGAPETTETVPKQSTGVGHGIKSALAGIHGVGESIRASVNAAVDRAMKDDEGARKNEAIAREGRRELETGKFSRATKAREEGKEHEFEKL
ncbi:uncharacterized protein PADG_06448 [Paracoccidioides brasiliensis Pb18]|uniref:Uncharacterized protein n=1 Tax=Paracoccidioides brasiliensis (strain Pb18) TaxID=502780 RepID=C1GGL1_PARBD|nr:uncharacterized protein PADG_06448 [Paracoccidioides brasiliensis Pb18]EEH50369.1 hypothetical protein PADG_06448 [Paracoccidioides brasiliensis Pb18]